MLIIALALAAAPTASPHVSGYGNSSCGDWAETRRTSTQPISQDNVIAHDNEALMITWVQGMLDGLSMEPPERTAPTPGSIAAWLDGHCAVHPLESLWDAALKLDLDLIRQKRGVPTKG